VPDHVAIVTALILDRPTCLRCIAIKAQITPMKLDTTIEIIDRVLVLHRTTDRCRACGVTDTVLSVDRPQ
jgi:hypothetical protein